MVKVQSVNTRSVVKEMAVIWCIYKCDRRRILKKTKRCNEVISKNERRKERMNINEFRKTKK